MKLKTNSITKGIQNKKNNNKKNKDEIWLKNKKTGPFPFWRERMQKPRIKETK